MAELSGLYVVTAVVLAGLFGWVILVLVRAPNAIDESLPPTLPPKRPAEQAASQKPRLVLASRPESRPSVPAAEQVAAQEAMREPDAAPPPEVKAAREPTAVPAATSTSSAPPGVTPSSEEEASAWDAEPPPAPPAPQAQAPAAAAAPSEVAVAPRTGKAGMPAKTIMGLQAAVGLGFGLPGSAPAKTPAAEPGSPAEPAPTPEGADSPVVMLPPMRSRLDSHQEIQDTAPNATVIVMPEEETVGKAGARMVLSTAVGRSAPGAGKTAERHLILERHHLFAFADGSGKKAGAELASAFALSTMTEAFEKNDPAAFPDDAKFSVRANRARRAVLAANRALLQKARASGYAGLGTSGFLAYFSPANDQLFVAHVGNNRAYRWRVGDLTRLTSPHGLRFLGLTEKVDVEVVIDDPMPRDTYLFCSDGLARALGDSEVSALLAESGSIEAIANKLIASLEGKDNVADLVAMVVRVETGPNKSSGRSKTVLGVG